MEESTQVEQLPPPKSKAELLDRIRGEHAALEQTIDGLSEQQITAPVDGKWSVKDMLAHITAWEQVMLNVHLGGRPFDQVEGVTYGTTSTDEINEAFYRRDKDRPLPDVLDAFRRSYQQVLAALDGMSEERLFGPYTRPNRDPSDGAQLVAWVAGDTYEHYQEHHATIQAVIKLE